MLKKATQLLTLFFHIRVGAAIGILLAQDFGSHSFSWFLGIKTACMLLDIENLRFYYYIIFIFVHCHKHIWF